MVASTSPFAHSNHSVAPFSSNSVATIGDGDDLKIFSQVLELIQRVIRGFFDLLGDIFSLFVASLGLMQAQADGEQRMRVEQERRQIRAEQDREFQMQQLMSAQEELGELREQRSDGERERCYGARCKAILDHPENYPIKNQEALLQRLDRKFPVHPHTKILIELMSKRAGLEGDFFVRLNREVPLSPPFPSSVVTREEEMGEAVFGPRTLGEEMEKAQREIDTMRREIGIDAEREQMSTLRLARILGNPKNYLTQEGQQVLQEAQKRYPTSPTPHARRYQILSQQLSSEQRVSLNREYPLP